MPHARALTLGSIVAIAVLAVPATAATPAKTGTDHLAGLSYGLKGKTLTLKILPQHRSRAAGPLLRGKTVKVSCGTASASGKPNNPNVARAAKQWPAGSLTSRITLSRTLGSKARWCIVYGGDVMVSSVDFVLHRSASEG
jgi:hypothetical protein